MEKYHKTDIAPVEQENERDESYPTNNPQIDCTRTLNNYNVIKRQCSYTQHINKRIAELDLPTKVRKDAVLMCSFVVGSNREYFNNLSVQEQEKFFADCTRFFADRYGEENIISAVVHMDETTPHLHLNLIPIADGRLCAKQLFDRKALQELQTDFHSFVGKKWNLQRGKEGSTAKHLDTMSYKIKKMKDEAVAAVLQASEAERRKEAAEKSQAHVEQTTLKLEEKREQLVAPLQAAADVAQEYNAGKRKPNKKDVPALAADNARLRKELEYSIKDQHDVFQLYQKTERERLSLQDDANTLRELRKQAPDKLINVSKVRGRAASIKALCQRMVETGTDIESQTVYISHGDCEADALKLRELVAQAGVKNIIINPIGPVIGAHSGPGTLALFFIGTHR